MATELDSYEPALVHYYRATAADVRTWRWVRWLTFKAWLDDVFLPATRGGVPGGHN